MKALNFNFSGSSQFNERDLGSGRQKNGASSGSLGATYFITKSTDRILLTGSASMNGIYLRSKAKDPTITNTNKSFFSTPRVVVLNKWFAKNIFTWTTILQERICKCLSMEEISSKW